MGRNDYYNTHHEVPLNKRLRTPSVTPPPGNSAPSSPTPDSNVNQQPSSSSSASPPRNRRILPIDDVMNEAPQDTSGTYYDSNGGGGGGGGGTDLHGVLPLQTVGNHYVFTFMGYVLSASGLNHGINYLSSFMPVTALIGKQADDLTQRGIAHLMLIVVLLSLTAMIVLYMCLRFIRKRRGVKGRLRNIVLVQHFGEPQYTGKVLPSFRQWIHRFMKCTGLYNVLLYITASSSRKKKKKEM